MNFYTISVKGEPSARNFIVFNNDNITFTKFIQTLDKNFIAVCHFTKDFKYISNLIVRRPEIVKLLILTKTITKQLKSKIGSMSGSNYLLKVVVITKIKTPNITPVYNGIVDKDGLIEKYLLHK